MYLEGRLDGHRALYLDETEAYVSIRSVKLENAFTIACWIKLMPSDPYYRVILRSEEQASGRYGFVFGVNSANQLQFENSAQSSNHVYTAGSLHEKQWIHVAVAFGFGFEVSLFINGFNHSQTSSLGFPWKILDSILDIGRYQDPSNSNYRYFHGYLSDLYIIGRTLRAAEIGKIMGKTRRAICTFPVSFVVPQTHSSQCYCTETVYCLLVLQMIRTDIESILANCVKLLIP